MFNTKKKIVIFSDGSYYTAKSYSKTARKIIFFYKDHKTSIVNKKNIKQTPETPYLKNFKLKYVK